ncbi:MAG TPA: class I SAM-dependent methyltransferase [Deltaproteobacteria bacterium]|nr:class I SAM-dependent methyltransferase [Deltaproteobacteria bacterium]HQI00194.1 class I SAM-dependent methyltransferase [Deltaproteobacteria bacterium]HQJ07550.1 class I SAM-dependent methyltransferase [Deltaproteobacteria bacterium]
MKELYSHEDIRKTYEIIREHKLTRSIIQRYAVNSLDIREVALRALDLSRVKTVLDLGCGYGFFVEKLGGRLHKDAMILGLDAVDRENRAAFLETVEAQGYRGEFIHARADSIYEMSDSCFDLVIASYSLYFFPHIIGEIARVLREGGIFIAITHSRHSLKEVTSFVPKCMEMIGLTPPSEFAINRLLGAFSLENGHEMLDPHFGHVERIVYPNNLLFPLDQADACIDYLEKKKFLIFKDVSENHPQKVEDMLSYFHTMIYDHARIHGEIAITKDDAVFRCRLPLKK